MRKLGESAGLSLQFAKNAYARFETVMYRDFRTVSSEVSSNSLITRRSKVQSLYGPLIKMPL